jgi:hypothetical protein
MNPQQPTEPNANPKPQKVPSRAFASSWQRINTRARVTAQIIALFVFLMATGAIAGYFFANSRQKSTTTTKAPAVTSLSQDDINKLSQTGTDLGSSGQTLNIGADALFRGKVNVTGALSIGGQLNANGPVTLSALNIAGASGTTGLNVGTNLVVGGTATFQKSLTVAELVSVGNLNVTGSASVNALNASTIAVRTLSISGPLTVTPGDPRRRPGHRGDQLGRRRHRVYLGQ